MTPRMVEGGAVVMVFVFGLVFGSFLNVVIARVPEGLSIVRPASRCPRCGHGLAWFENIPVLSWLALRGRCRACGQPISWRYPLIELLTALLFLACQRRFGWSAELVSALVMVLLLVPLSFIDLEHWILPQELTLPGIAAGVVLSIPLGKQRLIDSVIGAVAGYLVFWAMEWLGEKIFKKEALGAGDKDLLALIGAFLTWKVLLGVIFLSSLQGAVVGSLLLLTRGRAGPAPLPQAPPEPPAPGRPPGLEPDPGKEPVPGPGLEAALAPPAPVLASESTPEVEASLPGAQDEDEEDDWEPGPTNMPFGPWLSVAALEVLLLAPWLREVLPVPVDLLLTGWR